MRPLTDQGALHLDYGTRVVVVESGVRLLARPALERHNVVSAVAQ